MAYTDQSRRNPVAIGSVVLVHAAMGAALLSGLAVKFTPKPPDPPVNIYNVKEPPPPPPPQPVEPKPERVDTPTPPIHAPTPKVRLPVETPVATTTTIYPVIPDPTPPVTLDPPTPPVPPTPPPVSLARGVQIRGDQGGWFPQDSYPAAARRAGAQGRVGVSVDVGTDGRVLACRVVTSSGNDDLDAATCRLATRNGRFDPARGANGEKVTSTVTLRPVRWTLEQ